MPNTKPLTTTQTDLDGIKIFMDSAHGELLVDTTAALEPIFASGW
jgi:hypothetical protein